MSAVIAEPLPDAGRPGGHLERAVLILDDCEVDRMRLCRLIEDAELPFVVVEAETLEAMEAALGAREFDMVLIDYYLTDVTGFEALEVLAKTPGKTPVPIMITGDEQTEIAVQAMKLGCADYLSKENLSPQRLKAAIHEAEGARGALTASQETRLRAVEDLTGKMVSRYSNMVRPELARIVRELREVKSDLAEARDATPHQLQEVERRYGELWGKLRDPQTYRNTHH